MKRFLSFVLVLGSWFLIPGSMSGAPFYVRVNGTDYAATATGVSDYQGRTQYLAKCVSCKVGDVVLCYDAGSSTAWAITQLDPYGKYQNFTCSTAGLTCNVAGDYDFYIKMAMNDDIWYVGEGTCSSGGGDDPTPTPTPTDYSAAPAQCPDVMLQAFYWNSYTTGSDNPTPTYGRTKWIDIKTQAGEMGDWFDLVWLPPSSYSSGGTGYIPINYSNQGEGTSSSGWGTKTNLLAIIDSLHLHGARVVADVVINHVGGSSGWCTFAQEKFGTYGTFKPTASWICNTDEMNTSSEAGSCLGKATGAADDGYGSEANYEAARDWDHQNDTVRAMFKAYCKWLRYTIGYDGFRYDYCKGFHNSHINEYNTAALPYFSVMEYWDGNPATLQSHLNDAGYNTLTFDFATKYTALNDGIAADNYYGCKGAGLPGAGKARYACTFIDSHDTFARDNNEFCGLGNSMNNPDKVLQANAYILCMPGVPCVFYPHWVTFKDQIKAMINARYKAGVHSESSVSDEAGSGYYKATITGTNGTIRLLLGPNSGYATTPSGYTLAAKGTNWGVYYQMTTTRTDKNLNRTAIQKDVDPSPTALDEYAAPAVQRVKFFRDGHLYIQVGESIYDAQGKLVR